MEATTNFELAVYLAWFTGMFLIMILIKYFPIIWHPSQNDKFNNPKAELIIAFALIALLIGISTIFFYTDNILKKIIDNVELRYFAKLIIVYSPIWIYLIAKKQSLKTCFISFDKIIFKILLGILAALIASFIFLLIRGNANYYSEYLSSIFRFTLVDLIQTFLEGFAIGFVLYRFYAAITPVWAAAICAALFMLAHLPSYITGMGISVSDTTDLLIAHTGISFFIFMALSKTQDVISLFFIHWFINAATDFTPHMK